LDYDITNDPFRRFDVAMKWKDATYSPNDRVLVSLSRVSRILNLRCEDISKTRVARTFAAIFGYDLALDPTTFHGKCVVKSEINAQHDGAVISCPIESKQPGVVYQRLIDTEVEGGMVRDLRVPVLADAIPLVYVRYRPVESRFSNTNASAHMVSVQNVLSEDEVRKIKALANALGLDCGEVDALRDGRDGRLYIVDAATTPWGPPNHMDESQCRASIEALTRALRDWDAKGVGGGASEASDHGSAAPTD
jgi:hypothetical protein